MLDTVILCSLDMAEARADRFCGGQGGGAEIGIFGMLSSTILTMQLIINIINSSNANNNNNNDNNNDNNNNNLNDNSMVMIMAGPGQNMNSRRLARYYFTIVNMFTHNVGVIY